jgi:hypothetical protein
LPAPPIFWKKLSGAELRLIDEKRVMHAGRLSAAAAASAAPQMSSGHYIATETAASGRSMTHDWYISPCGDGCASVAHKDAKAFGQAKLVGGQWVLDVTGETARCPDGTEVPNALSAHYTWDPSILAGIVQTTADAPECGDPAGYQATNNIQLRPAS